ncbi:bacterio-opsin activator domain-containing protein [Haloarcula argentinensis]|uniref:Helix-turn-helix domain-containing protein n=1 Tax=Haloarcula argentinensis TaxID=43776 RepID=A0ABU2EWV2_HALAR|nr:bacterio-opsin activator domain-containing protein [Haloarcula argentinensis]EMA22378.1 bacterio-opsin activator-like protein [Haloarcula argentinensis DSM 12282]MDS0252311.1 helix-turn-helix domain-containing protein [Haloarcula argentinensis]
MDGEADRIGERGYEQLRRAAETHRSDLVLRLGAEVGLRPAEMTAVRLADIVEFEGHRLLAVREDGDVVRETSLPDSVEHDMRKYANAAGVDDEPLFSVSPRRLQMLVNEVADRAAETTPRLKEVSSRDLRWRFAASLLDDGVPPDVVCALGGWDRLDRLDPLLDEPDRETIVAAVDGSGGQATASEPQRTVGWITAVSEALAAAATGEAIATTVCEHLTETAGFEFAWHAERTGDGLTPRATAEISEPAVGQQIEAHIESVTALLDVGEVHIVDDSTGSVALVPLVRENTVSGVLGVAAGEGLTDTEGAALSALGIQVGHAQVAAERKRLLLADTVTELEFHCGDERTFTAGVSEALQCTVELSGVVPVAGQSLLYYLMVEGASADAILSYADDDDGVADARLLEQHSDGVLLEVVVTDTPALQLVESGGRIQSVTAIDGVATIAVELPGEADIRPTVNAVTDAYRETSLAAKRETERPAETDTGFRDRLADTLSDRQETVLQAAYHSGYFEWPRGSTAEELADSLDVSSPTLHNHLRKAQQKVLTAFFDDRPAEPRRPTDN